MISFEPKSLSESPHDKEIRKLLVTDKYFLSNAGSSRALITTVTSVYDDLV